jgi:uncharacterized membrane protein YvbJ
MNCPYCKVEINDDADYCKFCGETITNKGDEMKERGEVVLMKNEEKELLLKNMKDQKKAKIIRKNLDIKSDWKPPLLSVLIILSSFLYWFFPSFYILFTLFWYLALADIGIKYFHRFFLIIAPFVYLFYWKDINTLKFQKGSMAKKTTSNRILLAVTSIIINVVLFIIITNLLASILYIIKPAPYLVF